LSYKLSDVIPKKIIESLSDLVKCLNSDEDIRRCLSILSPVAFALKGLVDLYEDPEIMFVSYIIVDQFGNVQGAYDGHTDRWYELNKPNISELRKILSTYCREILSAITNNDSAGIIEGTKSFFSKFHKLARYRTMDVRKER